MQYASDTSVSVEKTRAEIESTLSRYGADEFAYMTKASGAIIAFKAHGKLVQFRLPLPDRADKRFWFTPARKIKRTDQEAYSEWEQACRSRWRSLFLCVKAKLEAVNTGITTFESEFLAHFVLPTGETFGEYVIPKLEEAISKSEMPRLMLMGPGETTQ